MIPLDINYSRQAEKFIRKHNARISKKRVRELIQTAIRKLTGDQMVSIDLVYMQGKYTGSFRIRTGDIRIIFEVKKGEIYIVDVEEIGFRGGVYKKR